ncbi:hypothetical protein DFH08DRAFT_1076955 [Mycena albidolilacea]|uniref:Uncharacterized protein n=1 Tax=Mycena albidolilacea TaxID=1033008 RepID=A0AAD7ACD0_9AGAR|nr:hypothetical protein DFH08DRAFT_1076955 [Mycena albidolilacea]
MLTPYAVVAISLVIYHHGGLFYQVAFTRHSLRHHGATGSTDSGCDIPLLRPFLCTSISFLKANPAHSRLHPPRLASRAHLRPSRSRRLILRPPSCAAARSPEDAPEPRLHSHLHRPPHHPPVPALLRSVGSGYRPTPYNNFLPVFVVQRPDDISYVVLTSTFSSDSPTRYMTSPCESGSARLASHSAPTTVDTDACSRSTEQDADNERIRTSVAGWSEWGRRASCAASPQAIVFGTRLRNRQTLMHTSLQLLNLCARLSLSLATDPTFSVFAKPSPAAAPFLTSSSQPLASAVRRCPVSPLVASFLSSPLLDNVTMRSLRLAGFVPKLHRHLPLPPVDVVGCRVRLGHAVARVRCCFLVVHAVHACCDREGFAGRGLRGAGRADREKRYERADAAPRPLRPCIARWLGAWMAVRSGGTSCAESDQYVLGDCETFTGAHATVSEGQAGGDEDSEEGLADHARVGNTRIRLTIYAPGSSFNLSCLPRRLGTLTSPSTVRHSPFLETWSLETDPTSHHPFALAPPLFLVVGAVSLSLQPLTCPFLYSGRSVLALRCFHGGGFGGGVTANFLFRTLDFGVLVVVLPLVRCHPRVTPALQREMRPTPETA